MQCSRFNRCGVRSDDIHTPPQSPSSDLSVEEDIPPTVECESLDEVEEMPMVASGYFNPVEEAVSSASCASARGVLARVHVMFLSHVPLRW